MYKFILIIFVFIGVIQIGFAQQEMQQFLNNLILESNTVNFEKTKGNEVRAKSILKEIDTSQVKFSEINKILSYYNLHNPNKDEYPFPLLQWARTTSLKINYTDGLFNCLLALGDANRLLYKEKEFSYYNDALAIANKQNNPRKIAQTISKIALQNMSYRDYKKAIAYFFEALDIYKNIRDLKEIRRIYHNLGDCYMHIDENTNAIKYLELSESVVTSNPNFAISAMNKGFLGELYLKNNNKKAFEYLKASKKIIEDKGVVPYLRTYNLLNLGDLELQRSDLKSAKAYYKKAFELSFPKRNTARMSLLTASKWAYVLNMQNKFIESQALLNHVETYKISRGNFQFIEVINSELAIFYDVLAETYNGLNDFENGYRCRVKQILFSKKANEVEIKKNASELEKKYQSQLDQQEIQILKDENIIKQRNLIITLLSLSAMASLLVFGYIYTKQRAKSLQRKAELIAFDLEKEQINAEKLSQEKQISELELQLKQRELTTNSISLLQKKEQFGKMEAALKELKPLVNQNQKASQLLNGIISDCLASKTTYNWEEFRITFEKVHPKFYKSILQKHPNLSTNEKKLAAFLKLGLNSKDISAITHQANRTIIIARSRFRKKLNLNKDDNLANYIASF